MEHQIHIRKVIFVADDVPPDVTPPTLGQTWELFGPPMDGTLHLPSGPRFGHAVPPRGPKEPPVVPNYVVSPGSIEGATSQILNRTHEVTESYNSLKDYISGTKSWIYSVPDDHTIGEQWGSKVNPQHLDDPHPDWTQQMSAVSDNVLLQVADAVEMTGEFVRALNNAGQFYTRADKDSDLPTLPVHLEGHSSKMENQTPDQS
ncbi:hypothetical protein [Dactylosporangium sp. NPDC048998]|uniref:hypothetical protein n=1 Tax=Dactylosporangium sp. NPDC048998 TaxID=3363976 RepID=UPI0037215120